MSKAFALAGARLGYLAAAPELCDALRVVRLPYHLSAVTQAAASAALRHADELLGKVDELRAERDRTVEWLVDEGFEVAQSDANFVLFGRFEDRQAVWQRLLDRGVLIRVTGPEGWLRVSIGTAAEMTAFKDALTRGNAMSRDQAASSARPRSRRSWSSSTSTGRAAPTCPRAWASTTTCSPPSAGTPCST